MKTVISVAEKPTIAKQLILALSGSTSNRLRSSSKYNPIYEYTGEFNGEQAKIIVTSVTGHVRNLAFDSRYKIWDSCNPKVLLKEAQVNIVDTDDKKPVIENLKRLAANATDLFLFLDCDREGEAIAYEVIDICMEVNNSLILHRAHFSSTSHHELRNAFANPAKPNPHLNQAVLARQEVDLRSGAAFTRFQTKFIKQNFPQALLASFSSFGTCQFPTLSFIVDRFLEHVNFENTKFWQIELVLTKDNKETVFTWDRVRFFDKFFAGVLYEEIMSNKPTAKIIKMIRKDGLRYKPYPMTTVDLQNLATKKLNLDSTAVMKAAEKLYLEGYISYPRTETNIYPNTTQFKKIIKNLESNSEFGEYARMLENDGMFSRPRNGKKSDKAHPPIHPIKNYTGNRNSPEGKVFDLVSRHFLANCSKDAKVQNVDVTAQVVEELFHAKGLLIAEKNFLEVYEKFYYIKQKELPDFIENEELEPSSLTLKEGTTTAPKLLTENELIVLMDKNGVGTDATMHEHIKKIQERKYAYKDRTFFKPTQLGLALLGSYNKLNLDLSNPFFRAETERNYTRIAEGEADQQTVIKNTLEIMDNNYKIIEERMGEFRENFDRIFHEYGAIVKKIRPVESERGSNNTTYQEQSFSNPGYSNRGGFENRQSKFPLGLCSSCNSAQLEIKLSKNGNYFIGCSGYPNCSNSYWFKEKPTLIQKTSEKCQNCGGEVAAFGWKGQNDHRVCLSYQNCVKGLKDEIIPSTSNTTTAPANNRRQPRAQGTARTRTRNPQNKYFCFKCKEEGHFANQCPK